LNSQREGRERRKKININKITIIIGLVTGYGLENQEVGT
jgi:hypothetical protein